VSKIDDKQQQKKIELYPLPDGWTWETVYSVGGGKKNAIVDGPFGSNLKVSDYVESGPVPVLTTKNLEGDYSKVRYITANKFDELKRSAVNSNDILMAKIGSCGKLGIYPADATPAMIPANLLKVSVTDGFDLKYVYYFFSSSFFKSYLNTIIKSTAQPAFGVTDFKRLPFPRAPLSVQKRIVAEIEKQFSRLDEAVALLKRIQANLKRYKAAVLKAAVEGKLTEQWRKVHPDVEPADQLLKRILAERRTKWEAEELAKMKTKGTKPKDDSWKSKYKEPAGPDTANLPELPEGWVWARTDQLFTFVTSGSRGWASYYSVTGPIFLRMGNLDHESIKLDLSDIQRVQPPNGAEGLRTRVAAGDILISITADVGMVGMVPDGFEEAYINQHVSLARPASAFDSTYLAWFLACKAGQDQFKELQRGATKVGLGLDDIKSVNVSMPPIAEQKAILSEIDCRFSVTEELEATIETNLNRAERLRQTILQQAFSGGLA
jgi:type I restriction enzyme S subunit